MFETTPNQKTITMKMKRIEVCDLLIACTAVAKSLEKDGQTAGKWNKLHEKLKNILDDFDAKNAE